MKRLSWQIWYSDLNTIYIDEVIFCLISIDNIKAKN